jgi:hypothetical protein
MRPAVDQDVQAPQLLRRLGDHAVHLLRAGDIGGEGKDAPVRRGSQLSRRRLQIPLFRATIATSTPSRANSRAIALPMPRLPPATIACLPCNPRSMALSLLGSLFFSEGNLAQW